MPSKASKARGGMDEASMLAILDRNRQAGFLYAHRNPICKITHLERQQDISLSKGTIQYTKAYKTLDILCGNATFPTPMASRRPALAPAGYTERSKSTTPTNQVVIDLTDEKTTPKVDAREMKRPFHPPSDLSDAENDEHLLDVDLDQIVAQHYEKLKTPQAQALKDKTNTYNDVSIVKQTYPPNQNEIPSIQYAHTMHDQDSLHREGYGGGVGRYIQVLEELCDLLLLEPEQQRLHCDRINALKIEKSQLKNTSKEIEIGGKQNQMSVYPPAETLKPYNVQHDNDVEEIKHFGYGDEREAYPNDDSMQFRRPEIPKSTGLLTIPFDICTCVDFDSFAGYIEASIEDASHDRKWLSNNFPWSAQLQVTSDHLSTSFCQVLSQCLNFLLQEKNIQYFGYSSFREKQQEIMNATLSGRDVFALMPTGGGKSLTYQLPALCETGLTVVVSPLVALIQDQITQLKFAGIECGALGGSTEDVERWRIISCLKQEPPGIRLLYVTPEKVANSGQLMSLFDDMHKRSMLSRFVIDEAHCVSAWGHDFRKDYKELRVFKMRYPNIPVLVLTATATTRVQEDIVQQLHIQRCIKFKLSFNRKNLQYEVRKKTKNCINDIKDLILANCLDRFGRVQTGIVYCFSKFDCEKVSADLREAFKEHKCGTCYNCKNFRRCSKFKVPQVDFYHAGLEADVRESIQSKWSNDEVQILCATIAFGMGINKPDVRFVIHYSLPKSLEGYHQEAGRAGRDLNRAKCVLFYRYADYQKLKRLLEASAKENNAPPQQLQNNMECLNGMVSYCENAIECRRVLLLRHFGEIFDPKMCGNTCDNCQNNLKNGNTFVTEDVSQDVLNIISIVRETGQCHLLTHIVDVFRGSNNQKVRTLSHNKVSAFGKGSSWLKNEAARLIQKMVIDNILIEVTSKADNIYQTVSTILRVNSKAEADIKRGNRKVTLSVPKKAKAKSTKSNPKSSKKTSFASVKGWSSDESQGPPESSDVVADTIVELLEKFRLDVVAKQRNAGNSKATKWSIFNEKVIEYVATVKPKTLDELAPQCIGGWSKNKRDRFGVQILDIVREAFERTGKTRRTGKRPTDSGPEGANGQFKKQALHSYAYSS